MIKARMMMARKTYPTKAPGFDKELSKLYLKRLKKLTLFAFGTSGSPLAP
jgi:hypothetical protein